MAEGTGLLNRHSGNTIVSSNLTLSAKHGLVVQLVRVPACHAGRCGFESRPDRQVIPVKQTRCRQWTVNP